MKEYVIPFTQSLRTEINSLAREHDRLITERKLEETLNIFERQYELIRNSEDCLPENLRHHKGSPLFNWGIRLILLNTPESVSDGYEKILLAYIEDLFDYDSFEQANSNPAYGEIVRRFPQFMDFLGFVQKIVLKIMDENEIPKDPTKVLELAGYKKVSEEKEEIKVTIEELLKSIKEWLDEKGDNDKRVFVGGSYKNIAVLKNIADIIEKLGFISIMACDCEFLSDKPYEEYIHDTSIMLLQECTYAIFEITVTNGHLMEIERAKDFQNLKVILVYQTLDPSSRPSITRMLMTTSFEKSAYTNFIQLTKILGNFLT